MHILSLILALFLLCVVIVGICLLCPALFIPLFVGCLAAYGAFLLARWLWRFDLTVCRGEYAWTGTTVIDVWRLLPYDESFGGICWGTRLPVQTKERLTVIHFADGRTFETGRLWALEPDLPAGTSIVIRGNRLGLFRVDRDKDTVL